MAAVAQMESDDEPGDGCGGNSEGQALCPHCLEEIASADHFCRACGGPLTSHASTDPIGHILAEGYAYRQAVSGRPGMLVLLGVWAIFGPQLAMAVLMLAGAVHAPQSTFTVLGEIGLVFMLALYAAILTKITINRMSAEELSDVPV